ncbi:MAG: GGDEF domain-containing protein [Xenococcaceae cyanobacterium]
MLNPRLMLFRYVENLPKSSLIVISLFLIIAIAMFDYYDRTLICLSIFYIIPVTIATWFISSNFGYLCSFVSAISWFLNELNCLNNNQLISSFENSIILFGCLTIFTYILFELKTSYKQEQKLARFDGLTGAINRQFFIETLETERLRSLRYGFTFTLAYLDIDNFKILNDTLGHQYGDRVLKLITETVFLQIRRTDVFARLGGDEFALLLPQTDSQAANIILKRVREQLLQEFKLQSLPIGVSIGALTFLTIPHTVEAAIEKTDLIMYQVKKNGKNALKHEYHLSFLE